MENTNLSTGSHKQQPQLPPGFRFHPTDEELVVHYLKNRVADAPLPVAIIAEIDLYKFDPWELPGKACFGEQEWYFFSPRDRKYPNGARPNRAATSGYWKATGTDKPVLSGSGSQKVGVKKALVFYGGKPPKGIKTNWVMHEYRLIPDHNKPKLPDHSDLLANKKGSLRLDDWVLCRIYKKKNNPQRPILDHDESCESMNEMMLPSFEQLQSPNKLSSLGLKASAANNTPYASFLENDQNLFEGMVTDGTNIQGSSLMNNSLSSFPPTTASLLSLKPTFPTSNLYWNSEEGTANTNGAGTSNCSSSSSKRFVTERGDHENVSFPSLLIQFPQNPQASIQQAAAPALGGNIGNQGVLRHQTHHQESQSVMNWYSHI